MKKILMIIGALIGVGVIYAAVCLGLIMSEHRAKPMAQPDTIVVLGAQVKGKNAATAHPAKMLAERLRTAAVYAKANPTVKIVVSGGQGTDEPISEAAMMSQYLQAHGVHNPIIEENKSINTQQNLANSKKITRLGQTVIVTSDFHMYRALYLAKKAGIKDVSGLAAVSRSSATFRLYVREIIAVGKTLIFG
ncbi:YdcF family protein [Periweissella cryptocerci]|nr:YdcF family protein [Periweissella cryptocerci]